MRKRTITTIAITLFAPFVVFATRAAYAKTQAASYAEMAPLDRYLITDRNSEVALARTAAPAAISSDARILILGRHGYETAASGKNGFTCLVERSWMSPFDSSEFWNPKIRAPICFNPQATRTVLKYTFARTDMVLRGFSKDKMHAYIEATYQAGKMPLPETGAMSYMMSKESYLSDDDEHWRPHLMFHLPMISGASWGANMLGSPVLQNSDDRGTPGHVTVFLVPVAHWSDGTAAP